MGRGATVSAKSGQANVMCQRDEHTSTQITLTSPHSLSALHLARRLRRLLARHSGISCRHRNPLAKLMQLRSSMPDRSLGLLKETIIPLSAVMASFSNRPHSSTVWRWTIRGVAGVKLETVRIGHAVFTSEEAVARFLHRINSPAPDDQGSETAVPQTAQ